VEISASFSHLLVSCCPKRLAHNTKSLITTMVYILRKLKLHYSSFQFTIMSDYSIRRDFHVGCGGQRQGCWTLFSETRISRTSCRCPSEAHPSFSQQMSVEQH
jgi:hypothetical protein